MTTEKAKAGARKPRARQSGAASSAGVPAELRHEMICTAAYFRAEQRGFCGDDSLDDWLAAEAEVDEQLRQAPPGKN